MEWACGDLTDPTNGPVLVCTKGTDKGEKSGYKVQLALDMNNRVRRWPVKPIDLLANRYNMSDLESFIIKLSNEEMIKTFVDILTGRNPRGIHERAFLNEVFGNLYGNLIPSVPTSPGASNTVQGTGGFGPSPVQGIRAPIAAQQGQKPANPEAKDSDDLNMSPPPAAPETPAAPNTATPPPMTPGTKVKFDRSAFMKKIGATPK